MVTRATVEDEALSQVVAALHAHDGNQTHAARSLDLKRETFRSRLNMAARRGLLLDHPPAMPGFEITKVTTDPNGGKHITQKAEHGNVFEMPATHVIGKMTVQRDAEGRVVQDWIRAMPDAAAQLAAMRATVDAFKEEIPRAAITIPPAHGNENLLNQYTVTDLHFGKLAWWEETGSDYDLKIAEQLVLDWFAMAIRLSPDAATGILAQLGDLLHHDSHLSVTPTHAHVLDADSRLQKVIRVVIRTLRRIIKMMLEKHRHVHIVMADANHDPASEAWLRELFASFYDDEPRITVDRSAGTYYAYEFGDTALFYHHGHRRNPTNIDSVLAGKFREIYGRTKHAYAHLGHRHSAPRSVLLACARPKHLLPFMRLTMPDPSDIDDPDKSQYEITPQARLLMRSRREDRARRAQARGRRDLAADGQVAGAHPRRSGVDLRPRPAAPHHGRRL
jgi:hypothetical protein